MDTAQKMGIAIFSGVPAIMGGGIVYALSGGVVPLVVYEILLVASVIGIVRK